VVVADVDAVVVAGVAGVDTVVVIDNALDVSDGFSFSPELPTGSPFATGFPSLIVPELEEQGKSYTAVLLKKTAGWRGKNIQEMRLQAGVFLPMLLLYYVTWSPQALYEGLGKVLARQV
jgi:hypothetical protein